MAVLLEQLKIITKRYLYKIRYQFFTKKITIIKWQFNIFAVTLLVVGLTLGVYVSASGIIRIVKAWNETTYSITHSGDTELTWGSSNGTVVTTSNLTLDKNTNWFNLNWDYKRPLKIKNTSGSILHTGSSITINIDSSALESVLANCNDIRVTYQSTNELPLKVVAQSGNCQTSKVTTLTFPIRGDIASGSEDTTNYALFYGNSGASAPVSTSGYSIEGGPSATMVCSFSSSTTCETGQTPSASTGAIRYSNKNALSFDGINDQVALTNFNFTSTNKFTLEAWIYPTDNGGSARIIIGKNSAWPVPWTFLENSGYRLQISMTGAIVSTGNNVISPNTWQHVAATYDGSATPKIKIFVNGQSQTLGTQSSVPSTISSDSSLVGIGNTNPGTSYFKGLMDEVRFSDNVRYLNNFSTQTNPFIRDANTVGLYHFDENGSDPRSANTAFDDSGNSNNGTISGGAKYVSGIIGVDSNAVQSQVANQSFASHQGVFVEEGTTNRVKNPSFETNITDSWTGKSNINFTTSQVDADGNALVGSNNIKDVFFYDTTKDSDGGAWRNNATAQSKSWYTEAFSTTRGKKREFPEKAYIVASDTSVSIIDAVENKLWMRFIGTWNNMLKRDQGSPQSSYSMVYAINGKLYAGVNGGAFGGTSGGLSAVNFITDSGVVYKAQSTGRRMTYNGNISQRNSALDLDGVPVSPFLITDMVNDVSVQVISGKTYVAVATDGGVSVINETDGTVVNFYSSSQTQTYKNVVLTSNGVYFTYNNGATTNPWRLGVVYTSSAAWTAGITTIHSSSTLSGYYVAGPSVQIATVTNGMIVSPGTNYWGFNSLYVTQGTSTIDGTSNTIYLGNGVGVNVIQEKRGDETHGSVKFYDKDRVSEEMYGVIKGQWGFWETISTEANQFKSSGYLDTGKMSQAVSMYGNVAGTTGSTLTFNRGAQISGNNYEHINTNQGTISFWFKPSWSGSDTITRSLFTNYGTAGNGAIHIYKDTRLRMTLYGLAGYVNIDPSSIVAGNWYHVVFRWNSQNPVSTTYYSDAYFNNTQSNGTSAAWTPGTFNPKQYIGSYFDGTSQAQSLIDDFAIYDRVLTTAEITSLYNSGNGNEAGYVADSSLKFYAKMDGSGTLNPVTYNGGASSSKMTRASSELTGGTNILLNGNMEVSAGGVPTNWTNGGATLSDAEANNILYDTRSQKVTATVNTGFYQVVTVSSGSNYHFSGWIKSDGTNDVGFYIWDVNNSAYIVPRTSGSAHTTSATWTNISYDFKIPSGCTSIHVGLRSISGSTFDYYVDNVSVTPNLIDNGGMEGTYSGGVAPSWTAYGSPITLADETTTIHSGSHSQKVVTGDNTQGILSAGFTVTAGQSYLISAWVYLVSGGVQFARNSGSLPGTASITFSTAGSWTKLTIVSQATGTGTENMRVKALNAATYYIDDVSVTPLDNVALSLKSWASVSDSSGMTSSLSVQGSSTGVQSLAAGVRNSALTFDGSTGYLRQQTIATNIGTLTYSTGNDTTTAQFEDDSTDFGTYQTTSGNALYMIVITNSDNTVTWGYLGTASGTGNRDITIYTTKARATRGWNLTAPIAGSKVPVGYEIRKTDFQITGDLSVGTWFKDIDDARVFHGLISKYSSANVGADWFLRIYNDNLDFSQSGGTPLTGTTLVNNNTWHHVVATYNSTTKDRKIYLDGNLEASDNNVSAIPNTPSSIQIGLDFTSGRNMNGSIDEPFVVDGVISPTQILDMYNKGLGALNHATKSDQKLQGTTSNVQSVWGSSDGTTIYAGTDTALSIIKNGKTGNYTDSDSVVKSLTSATTPALLSNNTVSMDIVNSSQTTPTMIVGSSASGVTAVNTALGTVAQDSTTPRFGTKSLLLDNTSSSLDQIYSMTDTLTAASYTMSFYAYKDGTQLTSSDVLPIGSTNPIAGLPSATVTYEDVGGGWTRVKGIFTGDTVANQIFGIQVRSGKKIYVDGVQLENLAYATTYADGSLGSNYAWTGSANNSTSTRTVTNLRYPTSGNLSYSAGSISMWVKNDVLTTNSSGKNNVYFRVDGQDASHVISIAKNFNVNSYGFYWGSQFNSAGTATSGKWSHLVLTFNGTTPILYINGVANSGSVGQAITSFAANMNIGYTDNTQVANGTISDLRLFNSALSLNQVADIYNSGLISHSDDVSNQGKYLTTGTWESPVMSLANNAHWGSSPNFLPTETLNGNTITYDVRTSIDGITWSNYQANAGTDPNYSITPNALKYVQVRATLNSPSQLTTPILSGMNINYVKDLVAPSTNAANTIMLRSAGGTNVPSMTWTNNSSPYFSWDQGADANSGLRGYCLSLSQDTNIDPINSKGLLGTSPVTTIESNCQFVVGTNSIDFSNLSYRGVNWLTTSNQPYYLRIRAIDNVGNVYNSGLYEEFAFKFDDTPPTNVTSISAPNNSFSNVNEIYFNWPLVAPSSASDANSDLLGYQYAINNETTWLGTTHSDSLNLDYLPLNTVQPYFLTDARDKPYIQTGNNTIYFKAIDIAGNKSQLSRTALIAYGGDAPKFADGSLVTVTPNTSSTNSFALSWPDAVLSPGRTLKSYFYMVNVTPPGNLSTLRSNSLVYIPSLTTTIPESKINGLVKGSNTIYVVVVDDLDNYSQSNVISGTLTLNSTLPDPVQNLSVSDSSIKAGKIWRASLAWEVPSYKGTGDLTYKIQRSEDGIGWTDISSTTGNSYLDTVPLSKKYYWRIGTEDSTNESKASPTYSSIVSLLPKGSYTEASLLTSDPSVSGITTKRATINWTTDRQSDSKVSIGITSNEYFKGETANSTQVTDHEVELNSLTPSTTYYYKARFTDEDGNTGQSSELSFTTDSAPTVKNVNVKYVSIDTARVDFTSIKATKVKLYYGKSTSFGGMKELSTSLNETAYTINLEGLDSGSKYFYRLNPVDSEGVEYEGTILDFTTLPKPIVSDVKIQQIKNTADTTILVTWKSNTELSSILSYFPDGSPNSSKDIVDLKLTSGEHKANLPGLFPDKSYILIVKGRDKQGNEAVSSELKFTTATDTRPPSITDMVIENIPNGIASENQNKAQVVITWNTDEPGTSFVEYGEGYSDIYPLKSVTDFNLTSNHMVVISGLEPSKVYHFRALSKDKADNLGTSSNMVSITLKGISSSSDLILSSLKNLFNF